MNQFDQVVSGSLDVAQAAAIQSRHLLLEPVHLLSGLIKNPKSIASQRLRGLSSTVRKMLEDLPVADKSTFHQEAIKPSAGLSSWLTAASSRAVQAGRQEVGEADLIANLKSALPELENVDLGINVMQDASRDVPDFLVNLNEEAEKGKLDPVIGRSKEIRSVVEILGRRRKNNPVLVGDAGVGKTAVVEGLAGLIVKGSVPDQLKDKIVMNLDLGALLAGTKYRGQFEEKLQSLLKFVRDSDGRIILFIDEMHQLVGAGKTDGAMDAANLLKPALARGELHCIGATTHDEFQKYILNDSALERRFRAVPIDEPSTEDAVEIVMGLKDKFEMHHGVEISDDAIFSSVFLSQQYLTDKKLPDKAIDLVDEAAAALKLSAEAMPAHLVELESEIRSKSVFAQSEKRSPSLVQEIADLQSEYESEKAEWERQVESIQRVRTLKNQLEGLRFELDKAQSQGRYEEASRIKYSKLPEVEKALSESSVTWSLEKKDIALVISRQTGIPVEKLLRDQQDNILELEGYLRSRVFGQDDSLHEIGETLVASHAGLVDPSRPLGSFLLLGPTGVGKTETAKAVAEYLFDTEDALIRFDLSEYSEKHSVAKLIGAPAGYVGYEDGGVLTEAVRRKPYAVLLFDEIEKAHPDFADILLQILDDGRLTDSRGRTISFRNVIVFATSNSPDPELVFKPEVLGRFDAQLKYKHLDAAVMQRLVERHLLALNDRLRGQEISLRLNESSEEELVRRGFDEKFGARPLNAAFSRLVVRPLSHKLLRGEVEKGDYIASLSSEGLELEEST